MVRRLLPVALALIALPAAGCGSSEEAAPAPAPAAKPTAQVQPAAIKSPDAASAEQRSADRRALKKWGRAASRACRRLDSDEHAAVARLEAVAPDSKERWTLAEAERVASRLRPLNREHEREYRALSRIPVPEEEEAAYKVFAFLDREEEGVSLGFRLAADLKAHDDPISFLSGLARIKKARPGYERAARRVHAGECTK